MIILGRDLIFKATYFQMHFDKDFLLNWELMTTNLNLMWLFSKKGTHKKGSHHHDDHGKKQEDGHEEHHSHKEEHGKKGKYIFSIMC